MEIHCWDEGPALGGGVSMTNGIHCTMDVPEIVILCLPCRKGFSFNLFFTKSVIGTMNGYFFGVCVHVIIQIIQYDQFEWITAIT